MKTNVIKILLADDTLIAREGWKKIFETDDNIKVVGEVTIAQKTLDKVEELKPDIVLMDLKWFGDDTAGWTAIKEIKTSFPKIKVIAVTAYENLIHDARLAGADAALTKTFTRDDLLGTIRELSDRNVAFEVPNNNVVKNDLSVRENEVLQLMAKGYSNKDIAKALNIALSTAKNHVKKVLEKLEAKNRTKAVSVARELGLIR